jgi:transcriptional regulator with XRE-family HTH domain
MPQPNGPAIQARREAMGIGRTEFASQVRTSYPHLHNIETRRKAASIELLWRIATKLGLPIGDVVVDDSSVRRSA